MEPTEQAKSLLAEAAARCDPCPTPEQTDFIGCLLAGVIGALPYFLDAFLKCLSGGTSTDDFKPGNRNRCD